MTKKLVKKLPKIDGIATLTKEFYIEELWGTLYEIHVDEMEEAQETEEFNKEQRRKDELLVNGYCRKYQLNLWMNIPTEIVQCVYLWYHLEK